MSEVIMKVRKFYYRVRLALIRRKNIYPPKLAKRRRQFYHEMWAAGADRVGAKFEIITRDYVRIWRGSRNTYFSESQTVLDGGVSQHLAACKMTAHRVLADIEGYCSPDHIKFNLTTLNKASDFMRKNGVIVVKPADGTGAGVGVACGIKTQKSLEQAALTASLFCDSIIAESQIEGDNFRLLFLDGKLLHTVRRDSPTVVGDGKSSIAELVEQENIRRISSQYPVAFSPLEADNEMKVTLESQGLTLSHVPIKESIVQVKLVSNQNAAGENVEDGPVCEAIQQLGADIASCLRLRFMGLDLMTKDLGLSLPDAGGVVVDINGSPGLHHHFLCDPNGADPLSDMGKVVIDPVIEASLASGVAVFGEGKVS